MILLRPDCLVFKTSSGENVPCSAQQVTLELLGEAVNQIDEAIVQNAAHAVLHYFRSELNRTFVTIGEFAETLANVLRNLGLQVETTNSAEGPSLRRVVDRDLRPLVAGGEHVCELVFFQMLRAELRDHIATDILRFNGLRSCVKQIVGAQRWGPRCQRLSDQIVDYLRDCLTLEAGHAGCALVVR